MNTSITTTLHLGELTVAITYKGIKNVHLTVHPPQGEVRVSAPLTMNPDTVRVFIISKLAWIRQQRRRILAQEREAPRDYINRESHFFRGRRYLLDVI